LLNLAVVLGPLTVAHCTGELARRGVVVMCPTAGALAADPLEKPLLHAERTSDGHGRRGLHLEKDTKPWSSCLLCLCHQRVPDLHMTITIRGTALALLLVATAGAGYALGWARGSGLLPLHASDGAATRFPSGWLPLPPTAFYEHAANVCSSFFFLSPLVQMAQVYASRGEALEGVNPQTIILMFFNCSLWMLWGLYAPMWPAVPANALGFAAATCYLALCWSYVIIGRSKSSRWGRQAVAGTVAAMVLVMGLFLYVRTSLERAENVGFLAMFICIALFASPLSVVRQVLADRSSVLLPPVQCAMQFLNCLLWIIVGVHARSLQILVCNVLGISLAGFQLGLIAAFPAIGREQAEVLP